METKSPFVKYTGPGIAALIAAAGEVKENILPPIQKAKSPAWHNQHYATPERQLKRKEMAYIGKRQYKKLKFALELRKSHRDYKAPHNGPDGDPYTYITYPVEGSAVKGSIFKGDPLVMKSEGILTVSDTVGMVIQS